MTDIIVPSGLGNQANIIVSGTLQGLQGETGQQGLQGLQGIPGSVAPATVSTQGGVKLANHLAGTADVPLVVGANFSSTGITFVDTSGGVTWTLTIDPDGSLTTTNSGGVVIPNPSTIGQPIGLLLALTASS